MSSKINYGGERGLLGLAFHHQTLQMVTFLFFTIALQEILRWQDTVSTKVAVADAITEKKYYM